MRGRPCSRAKNFGTTLSNTKSAARCGAGQDSDFTEVSDSANAVTKSDNSAKDCAKIQDAANDCRKEHNFAIDFTKGKEAADDSPIGNVWGRAEKSWYHVVKYTICGQIWR